MICFEPVQVSTGLPYYRRPVTIKVATNLTRRVHFYWSIGDVRETRVCLPALGAEGTLLAGGSPYSPDLRGTVETMAGVSIQMEDHNALTALLAKQAYIFNNRHFGKKGSEYLGSIPN